MRKIHHVILVNAAQIQIIQREIIVLMTAVAEEKINSAAVMSRSAIKAMLAAEPIALSAEMIKNHVVLEKIDAAKSWFATMKVV